MTDGLTPATICSVSLIYSTISSTLYTSGSSTTLSAAELILQSKGNFFVKMLWHFVSCLAGFLLLFIIGGGYADRPSAIVIGTFLFIIAYLAINITRFAVTGKFKRMKEETEEYDEVFKK